MTAPYYEEGIVVLLRNAKQQCPFFLYFYTSGQYDPITPYANAQLAMKTLSNSFLFSFPATGHGVFRTNPCPNSIVAAFLQHPTEKPDATCIHLMPKEPNFQ